MKKSSKTFNCSDLNQNVYGFSVDTAGIKLDSFLKNPVCLLNHNYDKVMGSWEDVLLIDQTLQGVPVFDTEDEEANKYYGQVERDVIKGASIGIIPLAMDQDVITSCELLEISITPVPANRNALVIYNTEGIALSATEAQTYLLSISNNQADPVEEFKIFTVNKKENAEVINNPQTINNLNWTFDDYAKHDPSALLTMQDKEPGKFKALYAIKVESLIAKNPGAYNNKTVRLIADRKSWTFDEYSKNDPIALAAMQDNNPDEFMRLYSFKVKELRATGLIAL